MYVCWEPKTTTIIPSFSQHTFTDMYIHTCTLYLYIQYQACTHNHNINFIHNSCICDADFGDFDNTIVQVTFLPDEDSPINERSVPITIVDDDIDEATEQIFVVTLKHKESIREESISLEIRNSSLCRIIDNDGK